MKNLLFNIRAWDKVAAARVDLWIGDCQNADAYGLNATSWEPAVAKRPVFSIELMSPQLDGKVQTGKANFTIALNAIQNVTLPSTLDYSDAPITIWSVDDLAWDRRYVEFSGNVDTANLDRDTNALAITAAASTALIDVPLLTLTYSGASGLNGETALAGSLRPAGFGVVEYIEPVWIDSTYNIGQVDGYGNLVSVQRLMEGANDWGASVGDYANYAALQAAIAAKTIPPGRWGTCIASGLIGLGAPPVKPIGVNCTFGYGKPGTMMQRIIKFMAGVTAGLVVDADFDALTAQVEAVIGATTQLGYWTKEQRQCRDLLEAIAGSCNATPLVTMQGTFSVTRGVATATIGTLDRSGSIEPRVINWKNADTEPPYSQLKARTARPARVLSKDEVLAADVIYPTGPWSGTTGYRLDNQVDGPDGASWIYINATPTVGPALPASNYPPAGFASNAYWQQTGYPAPTHGTMIGVADGATSDLKLTSIGSTAATINGNSATRNSGAGDFNAMVRGAPVQGPQYLEIDIVPGSKWTIAALDNDATSTAATALDLRVEFNSGAGGWTIYSSGNTVVSSGSTGVLTGKLRIAYDGIRFRIFQDQTQLGADIAASAANLILWPKWALYETVAHTGMRSGPYTSNIWPDIDGTGRPADNAGTTLQLTGLGTGTYRIIGNSVTKTATNGAFDTAVRGQPLAGAMFAQLDINPTNSTYTMVGFNASGTTYDRSQSAFFAQYSSSVGTLDLYVAGVLAQNLTPGTGKTGKLTITYDGIRFRCYLAGAQVGADVAATVGQTYYPAFFIYNTGNFTGLDVGQGAGSNVWADQGGTGVPSSNAGTTLTLVSIDTTKTSVVGNSFGVLAAGGWTSGGYSKETWTGACALSFIAPGPTGQFVMGLDQGVITTAASNYNQIDYPAFFASGNLYSDIGSTLIGTYAGGEIITMVYDGVTLRYYKDTSSGRTLLATIAMSAGLTFRAAYAANSNTAGPTGIRFEPSTSNAWSDTAGAGRPSDNAGTSYIWSSIGSTTVNITGNTGLRASGSGDYNACMLGPGFSGTASVSKKSNTGCWNIMALDDDRTTFAVATSKYHLEWWPGSNFTLYGNGSTLFNLSGSLIPTTAQRVLLGYDGINVFVLVDGVLAAGAVVAAAAGQNLNPKVFCYTAAVAETDIQTGPYTDRSWVNIGGAGRPADNATMGDNMVLGADLSNGVVGWGALSSAARVAGAAGDPAPGYMHFTADGGTAQINGGNINMPVEAATILTASFWVRTSTIGCSLRFIVSAYKADGVTLVSSTNVIFTPTLTGTWQFFSAPYTVPALATQLNLLFYASMVGGATYVDGAMPRMAKSQIGADVTIAQPVVQLIDFTTGRAKTGLFLSTNQITGVKNVNTCVPVGSDAGTTATITIPSHTRKVSTGTAAVTTITYNSGSITGLSYSTIYYIYASDPTNAGGTVTYIATTTIADLVANTGLVFVGQVITPAHGAGNTGGTGGGSTGGGQVMP